MPGFIAVHLGAGWHAESARPSYQKTCKEACNAALTLLKEDCDCIEAITAAVTVLEDCPGTNAGTGSNLTMKGHVECDAAIMEGLGLKFGSVGALSNIKNPVQVARKILEAQHKGLSCGRVAPCTLVGKGAFDWALERGFTYTPEDNLKTKSTRSQYVRYRNMVARCEKQELIHDGASLDTIGAVCVDSAGNVSGAVSSGGLWVKTPGRIGQAAVYGAGCWAQNSSVRDKPSVACSVSGVGEYLVKTLFARECYQMIYDKQDSISVLKDAFKERYLESPYLRDAPGKTAGVLTLKHYASDNLCELAWAHNSRSMIFAYRSTLSKKTAFVVSEGSNLNSSIVGGEKCIRLVT